MKKILITLGLIVLSAACFEAKEQIKPDGSTILSNKNLATEKLTPRPLQIKDGGNQECPNGMVKVEGDYCPEVEQICLKWLDKDQSPSANGGIGPMRCAEFKQPTKCLSSKRKHLSFCMDEFEYPGENTYPKIDIGYYQAKKIAEEQGNRLCTSEEFNFACEGPDIHPYGYGDGYHRDPEICNVDKEWRDYNKFSRNTWSDVDGGLYQAVRSTRDSKCKSWAGIYNILGNVDEILDSEHIKNVLLAGGYWGPVRSRCRPRTDGHDKSHSFYQLGFRMCRDSK